MTAWWEGPMLGFDLETTTFGDPDPELDRIVSFSLVVPGSLGRRDYRLVNPGVPISPGSTEIHGITDEMVDGRPGSEALPPYKAVEIILDQLHEATGRGIPIVGMNLSYDLTVLDRESTRHRVPTFVGSVGYGVPVDIRPVIDIYVLDKQIDTYRTGSRKLPDMCAHYGVAHNGAHDALQDTLAACRVAWKIGRLSTASAVELHSWYERRRDSYNPPRGQYRGSTPYLGQMQALAQIGQMNLEELHAAQMIWRMNQMIGLQKYLRKEDPTVVCDGRWPVIPPKERT